MDATPLHPSPGEAEADWGARVRANREQAERLREERPTDDFYAPVASVFRADPTRLDDPTLNALLDLVRPGDAWLDLGAGGGRYGLGIARAVRHLVAVEPSEAMRAVFSAAAVDYGIENVDLRGER